MQVHTGITAISSQDLEVDSENIKSDENKTLTRKKDNKITESKCLQKKIEAMYASVRERYRSLPTEIKPEVVLLPDDEDASTCPVYIDLECTSEKHSRYISKPL